MKYVKTLPIRLFIWDINHARRITENFLDEKFVFERISSHIRESMKSLSRSFIVGFFLLSIISQGNSGIELDFLSFKNIRIDIVFLYTALCAASVAISYHFMTILYYSMLMERFIVKSHGEPGKNIIISIFVPNIINAVISSIKSGVLKSGTRHTALAIASAFLPLVVIVVAYISINLYILHVGVSLIRGIGDLSFRSAVIASSMSMLILPANYLILPFIPIVLKKNTRYIRGSFLSRIHRKHNFTSSRAADWREQEK